MSKDEELIPLSEEPAYPLGMELRGLTKLEYFAGQALQGLMANPATWDLSQTNVARAALNGARALINVIDDEYHPTDV